MKNFDSYLEEQIGKFLSEAFDEFPNPKRKMKRTFMGKPVKEVLHKDGSHFTYYIMEDGKTIYAELTCSRMELIRDTQMISFGNIEEYLLKGQYVGRAILADGDNYDVNYGMRLARTRALKKYYTEREKLCRKYLTVVCNTIYKPALKQQYHAEIRLNELEDDVKFDDWHY